MSIILERSAFLVLSFNIGFLFILIVGIHTATALRSRSFILVEFVIP
ncbi:hypothetical protein TSIB_0656 [Thermococcus sibiricus MM 739]|uniref:Uncharacterized protein n=1 Tax=Thermococcus sibiricus (strain DSM 12597 / MM 739) TaxID=604354 RepID=C6A276_THESM|nr:hypothetical protein TSIB_0656 [Thermococcus sibiricus MM 739]